MSVDLGGYPSNLLNIPSDLASNTLRDLLAEGLGMSEQSSSMVYWDLIRSIFDTFDNNNEEETFKRYIYCVLSLAYSVFPSINCSFPEDTVPLLTIYQAQYFLEHGIFSEGHFVVKNIDAYSPYWEQSFYTPLNDAYTVLYDLQSMMDKSREMNMMRVFDDVYSYREESNYSDLSVHKFFRRFLADVLPSSYLVRFPSKIYSHWGILDFCIYKERLEKINSF